MKTYVVDLSGIKTLYDLHIYLKSALSLPDYYGMNMDALWDCLYCAFPEPTLIEVKNSELVPASLEEHINLLRTLLLNLAAQDPQIEIIFS